MRVGELEAGALPHRRAEAPGLLDSCERQQVYVVEGRDGTYMRLSPSAWRLLTLVNQGESFEQIADRINSSATGASPVTAAEVEGAWRKFRARMDEVDARGGQLQGTFWLRLTFLKQPLVARLARWGAAAYAPGFVVLSLLAASSVAADAWLRPSSWNVMAHFWPTYGLFFLSLLAHEMGHASACSRYGAPPGEIGFVSYFIYPAFYSNVNAAWKLKRWQRVVVDMGGVYFQVIVAALYGLGWRLSGWEPFRLALLFIGGSCLFALNPLLLFDGYWVLADALGVLNLRAQAMSFLGHVGKKLLRQPVQAFSSRLPAGTVALLGVYAILSAGFWAWLILRLAWGLARSLPGYGAAWGQLLGQLLATSHRPSWALLRELAATTYIVVFVLLMLYRAMRRFLPRAPAR